MRLVRGVTNGPSPEWMHRRLEEIGLRSINALVDITNYITFDRGRPLHVFDAKKVQGELHVRRARDGERYSRSTARPTNSTRATVVIADDNGVESIAGIMGGEHSGCDETTTDVLIESALWDPINIAQSGRRLGIVTDARYRFERGVDPAFTSRAPTWRRASSWNSAAAKPRASSSPATAEPAQDRFPVERGEAAHGSRPRRAECWAASKLGSSSRRRRRTTSM